MEFAKLNPYVRYARAHQNIVRPLEPAVCYDCRLFYFHKASGTFQWDQQTQKLVDGTVVYLPPGSTVAVDGQAYLFTAPCRTGKSTHTRL